jgi:hypothetical protein
MSLATTIYQYPTIKLCEFVENTKAAKPLVSHSNIKRELKWRYCHNRYGRTFSWEHKRLVIYGTFKKEEKQSAFFKPEELDSSIPESA